MPPGDGGIALRYADNFTDWGCGGAIIPREQPKGIVPWVYGARSVPKGIVPWVYGARTVPKGIVPALKERGVVTTAQSHFSSVGS